MLIGLIFFKQQNLLDGAASHESQTFTMFVTSLPEEGANLRVYKTLQTVTPTTSFPGDDYVSDPVSLTLGSNNITVNSVGFDRNVKFQFSNGNVGFNSLSLNGEDLDCTESVAGCTDYNAGNYNSNATQDDGSCEYLPFSANLFDDVTVISDVVYGANMGVLTGTLALDTLKMDVYMPADDANTDRPVIVLLHTGTFLPPILNGQATGDKTDNNIVELCKRFAKKGYVAVAPNYRLGWNPLSTDPDERTSTLAQAFYRAQQDARTAVCYLRMTRDAAGNPYGIGDKFAVGGDGTGGYMALALAALDKDEEVLLPKFIDTSDPENPVPYIVQSMWENLEATNYGFHPLATLPDGSPVPLCIPNHVGYSSEIDMAFNFGGAMLDTLWIEEGEVPIATFQNISDEFAPYDVGVLTEPVNNDLDNNEAMGGKVVIARATALGNNDCFAGLSTTLNDVTYGNGNGAANAALAGHADMLELFHLVTPTPAAAPTPCGFKS